LNTREEIADFIYNRLLKHKVELSIQFHSSSESIGYFIIDDLLPDNIAERFYTLFPTENEIVKRKNLREYKYVAYEMNKYNSLLEEAIYAFQDKKIVHLVAEICGLNSIYPDDFLYAGGLSLMKKDNYLNPHLDNSHDRDRNRWRVLNLLYYVTPNWALENGGNLELWNNGLKNSPVTIHSKFNRLVVMATHQKSWHSVSKVNIDKTRCCISNYYFSDQPLSANDTFHVTTFRGRPEEKFKNMILTLDSGIRGWVRKLFKKGIRENPHQYKK